MADEIIKISPADLAARLSLYKSELRRRALVILGAEFLPLLIIAAAIFLFGNFFPLYEYSIIAFIVSFWLLLAVNLGYFYYVSCVSLPNKIGLRCPACRQFLLNMDITQLTQAGKCSKCGAEIILCSSRH